MAMDTNKMKDKALNYVNAGAASAGPDGAEQSPYINIEVSQDPAPVTEEEEKAYTETALAWLDGVTNVKKRRAMAEYYRDVNDRAEKFYVGLMASLYRLKHEIQENVMDDPEISGAIEKYFQEEATKNDWSREEMEKKMEESKQCLGDYLHGQAIDGIVFQAAVKNEHHKDVAGTIFFTTFFNRLSDPGLRREALKKARELLRKDGYTHEQINKMFGTTPPVKFNPTFGGRRRKDGKTIQEIRGVSMHSAGLQTEVWLKVKKHAVNDGAKMVTDLKDKTGYPDDVIGALVGKVGQTLAMHNALPTRVKGLVMQQFKHVSEKAQEDIGNRAKEVGMADLKNRNASPAPTTPPDDNSRKNPRAQEPNEGNGASMRAPDEGTGGTSPAERGIFDNAGAGRAGAGHAGAGRERPSGTNKVIGMDGQPIRDMTSDDIHMKLIEENVEDDVAGKTKGTSKKTDEDDTPAPRAPGR